MVKGANKRFVHAGWHRKTVSHNRRFQRPIFLILAQQKRDEPRPYELAGQQGGNEYCVARLWAHAYDGKYSVTPPVGAPAQLAGES